jgi:hypothetical protein
LVIGTSSEADGLAHHRPAEDHLARIHRVHRRRAGIVEHELERRAEDHAVVAGLGHAGPGHRHHALGEPLPQRQQLAQRRQRADVADHHAERDGQAAGRHLGAEQRHDQHLLRALRILGRHRLDVDFFRHAGRLRVGDRPGAAPAPHPACCPRRR